MSPTVLTSTLGAPTHLHSAAQYLVQLVAILNHGQLRIVIHGQHHVITQRRLLGEVVEPSRRDENNTAMLFSVESMEEYTREENT